MTPEDKVTSRALVVSIMRALVLDGVDFADWLASVLAEVAARSGSVEDVLAGRPGSWEADLVGRLIYGTVGHRGEHLSQYGTPDLMCEWHVGRLAVAVVLRDVGAGVLGLSWGLCAECAKCSDCDALGVLLQDGIGEAYCQAGLDGWAAVAEEDKWPAADRISGPEIVALDSDRYRELLIAEAARAAEQS